ncbi:MAG: hypothetical protein ACRDJ2_14860 [Actinomycetota bacterium]
MSHHELRKRIEALFDDPAEPNDVDATEAVSEAIALLDRGEVRVAEKQVD